MSFENLGLRAELLRAVAEQGYTDPTPIQKKIYSHCNSGPRCDGQRPNWYWQDGGDFKPLPMLQRLCEQLPAQSLPAQDAAAEPSSAAVQGKRGTKPVLRKKKVMPTSPSRKCWASSDSGAHCHPDSGVSGSSGRKVLRPTANICLFVQRLSLAESKSIRKFLKFARVSIF